MKVHIRHFGKVIKGRKVYFNPELYNQQLLQLEGKEFEEVIKPRYKRATTSQDAYYRGAILPTAFQSEQFGHCDKADDIHPYFAEKFLSFTRMVYYPNGVTKEKVETRSMADLNREEKAEFIRRVLIECDLLNIHVLSPEQYYNQKYNL